MGLTLAPPAPYISRDKIPKFNLVEDFKQTVNDTGFPLPKPATSDDQWRPDEQSSDWVAFQDKWVRQPESRPVDVVSRWAERLNYENGAIIGTRPSALLKRFNTMIPALPMIAVGSKVS
jgi:hypothetical protein